MRAEAGANKQALGMKDRRDPQLTTKAYGRRRSECWAAVTHSPGEAGGHTSRHQDSALPAALRRLDTPGGRLPLASPYQGSLHPAHAGQPRAPQPGNPVASAWG